MNGLRIFIVDDCATTAGSLAVFYSRRSNGPYYRWWYERDLEQWRFARVLAPELPSMTLCASSWKNIPEALQRRLVEHYLE